jgi:hypothetical protein
MGEENRVNRRSATSGLRRKRFALETDNESIAGLTANGVAFNGFLRRPRDNQQKLIQLFFEPPH